MRKWITGLALVALAGCGDDPVEPVAKYEHSIRLEITWPLAAHPAIQDASFATHSPGPGCFITFGACSDQSQWDFDSAGHVEVRFIDGCTAGEVISSSKDEVTGIISGAQVLAYNPVADDYCRLTLEYVCQEGLQQVLIEAPEDNDNPACERPADELRLRL